MVVFGSTRLREPATAQLEVEDLQHQLIGDPQNLALQARLNVAQRLLAKSPYYKAARELGRLIGTAGEGADDPRVTLMTGGGPGAMEAANRGAFDVGARSIGLNITLPHEQYPNPYITPELYFHFHYFAMRKTQSLALLKSGRDLFDFPGLHVARDTSDSMAFNKVSDSAAVMAGAGMCTGGRIRHHLKHNLWRRDASVIFVGYAAAGTLARRIINGAKYISLFGEEIPVRAKIHMSNGFRRMRIATNYWRGIAPSSLRQPF